MNQPWYYFIYIAVGALLLWIFDKFDIIKPKALRYFIVILVYTLIWWGIYELIIAPK